jgi:hypothetical protein
VIGALADAHLQRLGDRFHTLILLRLRPRVVAQQRDVASSLNRADWLDPPLSRR